MLHGAPGRRREPFKRDLAPTPSSASLRPSGRPCDGEAGTHRQCIGRKPIPHVFLFQLVGHPEVIHRQSISRVCAMIQILIDSMIQAFELIDSINVKAFTCDKWGAQLRHVGCSVATNGVLSCDISGAL